MLMRETCASGKVTLAGPLEGRSSAFPGQISAATEEPCFDVRCRRCGTVQHSHPNSPLPLIHQVLCKE